MRKDAERSQVSPGTQLNALPYQTKGADSFMGLLDRRSIGMQLFHVLTTLNDSPVVA